MKKIDYQPKQESEELKAAKIAIDKELNKNTVSQHALSGQDDKPNIENIAKTDKHNIPIRRFAIFNRIKKVIKDKVKQYKNLNNKKKIAIGVVVFPALFAFVVLAKPIIFDGHLPFSKAEGQPTQAEVLNITTNGNFQKATDRPISSSSNSFGASNVHSTLSSSYLRHPFSAQTTYRVVQCAEVVGSWRKTHAVRGEPDWTSLDKIINARISEMGDNEDLLFTPCQAPVWAVEKNTALLEHPDSNGYNANNGIERFLLDEFNDDTKKVNNTLAQWRNNPSLIEAYWANKANNNPYSLGAVPDKDIYKTYIKQVYTRYFGKVQAIEVWNEPNGRSFYAGNPAGLAELTFAASEAINEVYAQQSPSHPGVPKAKLVSPGWTPSNFLNGNNINNHDFANFIQEYFDYLSEKVDNGRNGGKYPLQVASFHGYGVTGAGGTQYDAATDRTDKLRVYRNKLLGADKYAKNLELWDTEWNLRRCDSEPDNPNCPAGFGDNRASANGLVRASLESLNLGYMRQYSWIWEGGKNGRLPSDPKQFQDFSIQFNQGTVYSRTAMANLSSLLVHSTYEGVVNDFSGYDVYKFRKSILPSNSSDKLKLYMPHQYFTIERNATNPFIYVWVPNNISGNTFVSIDGGANKVTYANGSPVLADPSARVTVLPLFPSDTTSSDPYCGIGYLKEFSKDGGKTTYTMPWGNSFPSTPTYECLPNQSYDSGPINLSIGSPVNGDIVHDTITVRANASDPSGIKAVLFYLDTDAARKQTTTAPHEWTFDTNAFTNGTHTIKVKAIDNQNNEKIVSISILIDNLAPAVKITSPVAGSTVSGSVTIAGSITDRSVIKSVVFLVDDVAKNSDTTNPYSFIWNSNSVSNGSHKITVRATDTENNIKEASINVIVDNSLAIPGDTNNDKKVNVMDLSYVVSKWAGTDAKADINNDKKVNIVDLSIVISNWKP